MPGRAIYKLGTHRIRVLIINPEDGTKRVEYQDVPILTRCLERTGQLLRLERADERDIQVVKRIKAGRSQEEQEPQEGGEVIERPEPEIREVTYYRIGSWRDETIRLVYKKELEEQEQGAEEQQEQQGGEGEQQQEERYKLVTVHVPVPSWAPNYKVIPTLFSKARAVGLRVVGAYRNGYLIPAPTSGN